MKYTLVLLTTILSLLFVANVNAQNYYLSKKVEGTYSSVIQRTKDALKKQGFGVMTEIQMDKTLNEKLGETNMKPYLILGVCNPKFAFEAVKTEENIGLLLPCKVVIKEIDSLHSEVVFINPSEVMHTIGNAELNKIADQVTMRFKVALSEL